MSRLSPFVLNELVLSLLSLKCPFCPWHKRLKFAETVYDTTFIDNFEDFSGIKGRKGIF